MTGGATYNLQLTTRNIKGNEAFLFLLLVVGCELFVVGYFSLHSQPLSH